MAREKARRLGMDRDISEGHRSDLREPVAPRARVQLHYLDESVESALFPSDDRPCVLARRRFGRISIASSVAAATPHTDAAIDQGHGAVCEQIELRWRTP